MATSMDVRYCKDEYLFREDELENEQYLTWEFNFTKGGQPDGWNKKPVPEIFRTPTENPEMIKKAKEWFKISNEEDLIFLEKERKAFEKFYLKQINEIKKAQRELNK